MTAPELSHGADAAGAMRADCAAMLYAVLLRVDRDGARPVIVRSDEKLPCGDGASWRFVAQARSEEEARRLCACLERPGASSGRR